MTPLRQRMIEDMRVRNLAPRTRTTYLQQVSQFARHFGKSPEQLGPEKIRAYQVYLTTEKELAISSILIAVAALRFLYKLTLKKAWAIKDIPAPKKPQKLPVILSRDEVTRFLKCVRNLKAGASAAKARASGSSFYRSRARLRRLQALVRHSGTFCDPLAGEAFRQEDFEQRLVRHVSLVRENPKLRQQCRGQAK